MKYAMFFLFVLILVPLSIAAGSADDGDTRTEELIDSIENGASVYDVPDDALAKVILSKPSVMRYLDEYDLGRAINSDPELLDDPAVFDGLNDMVSQNVNILNYNPRVKQRWFEKYGIDDQGTYVKSFDGKTVTTGGSEGCVFDIDAHPFATVLRTGKLVLDNGAEISNALITSDQTVIGGSVDISSMKYDRLNVESDTILIMDDKRFVSENKFSIHAEDDMVVLDGDDIIEWIDNKVVSAFSGNMKISDDRYLLTGNYYDYNVMTYFESGQETEVVYDNKCISGNCVRFYSDDVEVFSESDITLDLGNVKNLKVNKPGGSVKVHYENGEIMFSGESFSRKGAPPDFNFETVTGTDSYRKTVYTNGRIFQQSLSSDEKRHVENRDFDISGTVEAYLTGQNYVFSPGVGLSVTNEEFLESIGVSGDDICEFWFNEEYSSDKDSKINLMIKEGGVVPVSTEYEYADPSNFDDSLLAPNVIMTPDEVAGLIESRREDFPDIDYSIVDFMVAIGLDSSRTSRKELYEFIYDEDYKRTSEQNEKLIKYLKKNGVPDFMPRLLMTRETEMGSSAEIELPLPIAVDSDSRDYLIEKGKARGLDVQGDIVDLLDSLGYPSDIGYRKILFESNFDKEYDPDTDDQELINAIINGDVDLVEPGSTSEEDAVVDALTPEKVLDDVGHVQKNCADYFYYVTGATGGDGHRMLPKVGEQIKKVDTDNFDISQLEDLDKHRVYAVGLGKDYHVMKDNPDGIDVRHLGFIVFDSGKWRFISGGYGSSGNLEKSARKVSSEDLEEYVTGWSNKYNNYLKNKLLPNKYSKDPAKQKKVYTALKVRDAKMYVYDIKPSQS